MRQGPGDFDKGLVAAAAALAVALLFAPVVRRITAELSCHVAGASPLAMGRLHVPPAPDCEGLDRPGMRTARRTEP